MSAESMASDPYEVVLADLRAKKAQIEQAISAIENLRAGTGGAVSQAASGPSNSPQNSDIDSPGAFLGMSISDAAKKLLAAKRQPMRNPDIAAAFKRGGLVLNSKDVVNTIGAVLARRANEVGDLVKVDRGTWGLKEWYPGRSFNKPKADVTADATKGESPRPIFEEGTVITVDPSGKPTLGVASVPFMITEAMKAKLRKELGYTDDQIREMTPAEAHRTLKEWGLSE